MGQTPLSTRSTVNNGISIRGIGRQIKIGLGIERDQRIDRSRHGLSRLSISLGEWTDGTTTGAMTCHSIGHGRKIGHRCPPWVADRVGDIGSVAHDGRQEHGRRPGGVSTNPLGNGIAKSAGYRGVN